MASIGDRIRGAVLDMVPGDAARKVNKALDTSPKPKPAGQTGDFPRSTYKRPADPTMDQHADDLHPVKPRKPAAGAVWDQ